MSNLKNNKINTATILSNKHTSQNIDNPQHKSLDPNLKKQRWNTIQNDLISALDTWQELDKKDVHLSPEEEQFQKIKSIISQLREKLEQF